MKKYESIQATNNQEREEIKKTFENQTYLLKAVLVFAVLQYFILLAII